MSDKKVGAGDYSLSVKIKDVELTQAKIATIIYKEGISFPTIEADIAIVDTSSKSLLSDLPLRNGEEVELKITTDKDEKMTANLVVYGVEGGGPASLDKSVMVLRCMSKEAMANLTTRVEKLYKEMSPSEIVKNVLKDGLKSTQEVSTGLDAESLTVTAMRDRPLDFICKIVCNKSIPSVTTTKGEGIGTAGYLFWQTSDGYNFKSMDELMGASSKGGDAAPTNSKIKGDGEVDTYHYNVVSGADDADSKEESRIVRKLTAIANNNIETQLIRGTRSNLVGFFDVSSLRYNEAVYKLDGGNFSAMGHLADADKPSADEDTAQLWEDKPTRIMTRIINNEMYETTKETAEEDRYDKIRQSLAQQIVRADLFKNQKVEINIPGNAKLRAGDKIILQIYKSQSGSDTADEDRIDKKQSGFYLIAKVVHSIDKNMAMTHLLLLRDQNNEV